MNCVVKCLEAIRFDVDLANRPGLQSQRRGLRADAVGGANVEFEGPRQRHAPAPALAAGSHLDAMPGRVGQDFRMDRSLSRAELSIDTRAAFLLRRDLASPGAKRDHWIGARYQR